jgi:hypothetical protein
MPREISQAALEAMLAAHTTAAFLTTLRVSGVGMTTLYFINDNLNHTISGQEYLAFPFKPTLATDDADKPPTAKIVIDNVTREIVDELRSASSPPLFQLAVRLSSQLDVVEYGPWEFAAASMSYDLNTVQVELRMRDLSVEPFPHLRYTPPLFPGLFSNA